MPLQALKTSNKILKSILKNVLIFFSLRSQEAAFFFYYLLLRKGQLILTHWSKQIVIKASITLSESL